MNRANFDTWPNSLKTQFMKTGSRIALIYPISVKEIAFEIKNFPTKKHQAQLV